MDILREGKTSSSQLIRDAKATPAIDNSRLEKVQEDQKKNTPRR